MFSVVSFPYHVHFGKLEKVNSDFDDDLSNKYLFR